MLKSQMRDYVRRQIVWFKKEQRIFWFDTTCKNWKEKVEKTVQTWLNNGSGKGTD